MTIAFQRLWALALLLCVPALAAHANNTAQTLPFQQNWSTTTQITANDNWSGVPGIEGYLGQDITTTTGADPQTLTGVSALANDLDVVANQTNTSITNGGVIEFEIANPVIALQGSGTADAPYLLINLDTTGQTGVHVAYNLRDVDGSADNAVQPVALQYRVGNSGSFINVPAGYVADATTGPSVATLVTAVSATLPAGADNQPLIQVRIITANAAGNDESVGIDDISITGTPAGGLPVLTVDDPTLVEGNNGQSYMYFTFTLSSPAGPEGVTFRTTTLDGTATAASGDYEAGIDLGAVMGAGSTVAQLAVPINGDTLVEADETFFVNIHDVTGAIVSDAQGMGTIVNDDFIVTPIHGIQGPGATSPLANQFVTTEGIVTGRKGNGFFLQASDAEIDADPMTSEGVFVFTGSAPPASAAVGNRVRVQGTVVEYVPTADPYQLPFTEISGSPSVTMLSAGNAMPVPVAITADMTKPDGGFGQLEPLEGMRVTAASLTTVAATEGSATPYNATGSVNGIIHAVISGVPRPFREPGLQLPDAIPGGAGAQPIPRWDGNPEILTIDSDTLGGAAYLLDLPSGSVIENLTGPLDYGFRRYTLMRDPQVPIAVTEGPGPRAARQPGANEFTVASYNLERFFDDINDANVNDSVATTAAYQKRLQKASLGIRDYLHAPDVLATMEIEKLPVLQAIADRINSDAVAAGQPSPQYVAYLEEGNDVGGIDVGFLVKTASVGIAPRVEVVSVTQVGKDTTWIQPDGTTDTLNDRPPLVLDAVVHYADGRAFPITVVGVHQRSLIGAELDDATADRVRKKRQRQAEFLASYLQQRQAEAPLTRIVTLGDFNAFAFNDGLTDVMGVTSGTPAPDEQTVVPGDGVDLVDPDFINLGETAPADQRYSFVFDGNAQTLDQVLINEELVVRTRQATIDHARINADFSESHRSDASTPIRTADHDPVIAYFEPRAVADLSVTASNIETSGNGGGMLQFSASVHNAGPEAAEAVGVGFAIDTELPTMAVTAPEGWTCDAAQIDNGRTSVACNTSGLSSGSDATFSIDASATAESAQSVVTLATVVSARSLDLVAANDEATASIDAMARVDLSPLLVGPRRSLHVGDRAPFTATLRNAGPYAAAQAKMVLMGNAPAANVSLAAPLGWQCSVAPDGSDHFSATCTDTKLFGARASQRFDMMIVVPQQSSFTMTAVASTSSIDTVPGNDSTTYANQVLGTP